MSSQESQSEANINAISKMKVAELKKELKARGLSTAGSKTELLERLQAVTNTQVTQDLISEDGNAESEILDEDEVLGGVEEGSGEFDDEESVLADEPKPKPAAPAANLALKRPVPLTTEASQEVQPKKRVLIRPISQLSEKEGKENESEAKSMDTENKEEKSSNGRKIIKISTISEQERLELRAQKFGTPLSDAAKKAARAARFGVTSSTTPITTSATKIVLQSPSEDLLKKRAERFGVNVSRLAIKVEEQEKLKKRQERFGVTTTTTTANATNLAEKKRLRAERFKL